MPNPFYTYKRIYSKKFSLDKYSFNAKTTVLFQTIQFSIQKQFDFKQFRFEIVAILNLKTVLFQAIEFSISTKFSSICHIDRTLSGVTTPDQSGPWSDVLLVVFGWF